MASYLGTNYVDEYEDMEGGSEEYDEDEEASIDGEYTTDEESEEWSSDEDDIGADERRSSGGRKKGAEIELAEPRGVPIKNPAKTSTSFDEHSTYIEFSVRHPFKPKDLVKRTSVISSRLCDQHGEKPWEKLGADSKVTGKSVIVDADLLKMHSNFGASWAVKASLKDSKSGAERINSSQILPNIEVAQTFILGRGERITKKNKVKLLKGEAPETPLLELFPEWSPTKMKETIGKHVGKPGYSIIVTKNPVLLSYLAEKRQEAKEAKVDFDYSHHITRAGENCVSIPTAEAEKHLEKILSDSKKNIKLEDFVKKLRFDIRRAWTDSVDRSSIGSTLLDATELYDNIVDGRKKDEIASRTYDINYTIRVKVYHGPLAKTESPLTST